MFFGVFRYELVLCINLVSIPAVSSVMMITDVSYATCFYFCFFTVISTLYVFMSVVLHALCLCTFSSLSFFFFFKFYFVIMSDL